MKIIFPTTSLQQIDRQIERINEDISLIYDKIKETESALDKKKEKIEKICNGITTFLTLCCCITMGLFIFLTNSWYGCLFMIFLICFITIINIKILDIPDYIIYNDRQLYNKLKEEYALVDDYVENLPKGYSYIFSSDKVVYKHRKTIKTLEKIKELYADGKNYIEDGFKVEFKDKNNIIITISRDNIVDTYKIKYKIKKVFSNGTLDFSTL